LCAMGQWERAVHPLQKRESVHQGETHGQH
jgi:hypothetical protein